MILDPFTESESLPARSLPEPLSFGQHVWWIMFSWLRSMFSRSVRQVAPAPCLSVVLYTRADCSLCEEMKAEMARARRTPEFLLEEVDIASSRDLKKRYGLRIPVLVINGRERFEGRLTADAFAEALRAAGSEG